MTETSVNDNNHLRLVKWPFYTGDGLLVLLAFLIVANSAKPLSSTAISWCVISVTFGALVFVAPFILEYLNSIRLAKNQLQEAVDKQLQGLDTILQELDALSSTLSDLAQKSANSTQKIEQFRPELQNHLKESHARIDSLLENDEGKVSTHESLSEVLNQRLDSLENKVNELVTIHTDKAVSEVIEDESDKGEVAKSEENDNAEKQNPVIEEDASVDNTPDEAVEIPDPLIELEDDGQDTEEISNPVSENNGSITLIAHLNLDISSTPYVRGEGAGLSWNEGVPMEFIEIGKWEWTVENAEESTSCRIFKDDSLAARGDDIVIEVGERAEVYPEFPEE